MRRALLLAALLAACGRDAPLPPASSFREAGSLIASTTRGGPADMAGEWVVAAAFAGSTLGGYAVPGAAVRIAAGPDGAGSWTFDPLGEAFVTLGARATGPGRYALVGPSLSNVWILWVDDDFRTAAVGTPDGTFGWIMDRPGEASPDRARAAREMLDFNGYDVGRLSP